MQVSATLIAAQQAAREAQARFQQAHAPTLRASFASALTQSAQTNATAASEAFSALPLKQIAPESQAASAATPPPEAKAGRPGALLDITI